MRKSVGKAVEAASTNLDLSNLNQGLASSIEALGNVASNVLGSETITLSRGSVKIESLLAEGGFGQVFKVHPTNSDLPMALKLLNVQSSEQAADAKQELKALQHLGTGECPHIVQLIDWADISPTDGSHCRKVYMLFPLFREGTAWDMAERYFYPDPNQDDRSLPAPGRYTFHEAEALRLVRDAAHALAFMHAADMCHRDMKPHNILLQRRPSGNGFTGVVMDLGSVTPAVVHVTSRKEAIEAEERAEMQSSAAYRAPELTQVANNCTLSPSVDMWALGCTLYCLAFGHSPFETSREGVLRLAILNVKWQTPPNNCSTIGEKYSEGTISLIRDLLSASPQDRPAADVVIQRIDTMLHGFI